MRFILRSMLILIACGALLVGVQVPSFVDQYDKRLDAHLIEARRSLKPFQEIADKLHKGSLDALIAKHEWSTDGTFQAEAQAIIKLRERVIYLEKQDRALSTSLPRQVIQLARSPDKEIFEETRMNYSFGILLDSTAVIFGFIFTLLVVIPLELLGSLSRLFKSKPTFPR